MDVQPGYRGLLKFAAEVSPHPLQPFQKRILRAHYGTDRELVVVLPRGSAKTSLAALVAVHHLLVTKRPGVYIGAASRDQARIAGSMVRELVQHPEIARRLVWRMDAVRRASDPTGPPVLQVVASDGAKAHGWPHPTLIIADELWAWDAREPSLLSAMQTSLLKNPACRFLAITTSAASLDSPLGRLRKRAEAAPTFVRKGAVLEGGGGGLAWLEWSLSDENDPGDMRAVAACNPLRSQAEMREQRARVTEGAWLQWHCCRWFGGDAQWLPAGAWNDCREVYEVDPAEPLILGVDIGGSRSATAVVGCVARDDGRVDVAVCEVWQGRSAVLEAVAYIERLVASGRPIREVVHDPMRFASEALRLERDHGLTTVEWPQSEVRMTRCAEHLHTLIVEKRIRHPGVAELDQHVAAAVAKPTPRGWRLVKSSEGSQIDALISLAMSAERATQRAPQTKFYGWV